MQQPGGRVLFIYNSIVDVMAESILQSSNLVFFPEFVINGTFLNTFESQLIESGMRILTNLKQHATGN